MVLAKRRAPAAGSPSGGRPAPNPSGSDRAPDSRGDSPPGSGLPSARRSRCGRSLPTSGKALSKSMPIGFATVSRVGRHEHVVLLVEGREGLAHLAAKAHRLEVVDRRDHRVRVPARRGPPRAWSSFSRPPSMRSRNALAPSAATIAPVQNPYGKSGQGDVARTSREPLEDARSPPRNSGDLRLDVVVAPFGSPRHGAAGPTSFFVPAAAASTASDDGGRIPGIRTFDRAQHERAVLRGARHRAELVERPGERHRAVARDAPVRRTKARHAARTRTASGWNRPSPSRSRTRRAPRPRPAPGPLDEPPLQWARFHGFKPGPVKDASALL